MRDDNDYAFVLYIFPLILFMGHISEMCEFQILFAWHWLSLKYMNFADSALKVLHIIMVFTTIQFRMCLPISCQKS
jgi:hypothetical protein